MPMQQQIQLQWKGPPVPRAKPLPPELWEAHREELSDLYQRMTLEDLMAVMKVRHGFTPNRRQFVFQFEKWGLNKYNTNVAKTENPTHGEEHKTPFPQSVYMKGKRLYCPTSNTSRTSIDPLHRTNSAHSGREKPPIPDKKRQKLIEYAASKDPYADLSMAFDMPAAPNPGSRCVMQEMQKSQSSKRLPTDSCDESAGEPTSVQSIMSGSEDWTTSSDGSDTNILSMELESSNCWNFIDFEPWAPQRPLEQIPQQERQIDISRPIDTFSIDEIEDMKRAADFLYGLGSEADACALYILILKRLRDLPNQPKWATTTVIIRCASSASTSSQVEIVRNLLVQNLGEETNSSTAEPEKFLFLMLLAETYLRTDDFIQANSYIEKAMGADLANKQLITCLPDEYRSLDILTYHYLTGGFNHDDEIERKFKVLGLAPPYAKSWEVQTLLIHKKPGPFELTDGFMQNCCLKSCLKWCLGELESKPSLSAAWKLVRSNKKNADAMRLTILYCCLWERSQSGQTHNDGADSTLWIDQTERLMGITAAELLWTICTMILTNILSRKDRSEAKFMHQALIAARSLHTWTDELLARRLLEKCSELNRLSVVKNLDFRGIMEAYAKDFIERKLWIRLPEIVTETFQQISNNSSPRQSFEIVAAAFLPTLASTLHSSELASLTTIRDRMHANVKDAMQGIVASTHLPSSGMRMSMKSTESNLSIPSISMSELSMAMARTSLSLSSSSLKLKENAESVMDTLANASNRARNKLNGSRTSVRGVELLELDLDDDLKAG